MRNVAPRVDRPRIVARRFIEGRSLHPTRMRKTRPVSRGTKECRSRRSPRCWSGTRTNTHSHFSKGKRGVCCEAPRADSDDIDRGGAAWLIARATTMTATSCRTRSAEAGTSSRRTMSAPVLISTRSPPQEGQRDTREITARRGEGRGLYREPGGAYLSIATRRSTDANQCAGTPSKRKAFHAS